MRLDKLLADAGFGSRKDVKAMIRQGRVQVDGETETDAGRNVTPEQVTADGEPVSYSRFRCLMLHKPAGVLTASRDRHAPTVMDLIPESFAHYKLAPVGRLDKDTTGLLLITDDGELAHRLLSPARQVEKVYYALCDRPFEPQDVGAFASGLDLGDFTALPARLELLPEDSCLGRITVTEGKFHQVKRMCEACGKTVVQLHRERLGPLEVGDLPEGEWRLLTDEEMTALREAAGQTE